MTQSRRPLAMACAALMTLALWLPTLIVPAAAPVALGTIA